MLLNQLSVTRGSQLVTKLGRAAVLPYDGIVNRLTRFAVPHHGGFALIRNPDGGNVTGGQPGLRESGASRVELRVPDLVGIVLDPACLREDLSELLLGRATNRSLVIKDDGP